MVKRIYKKGSVVADPKQEKVIALSEAKKAGANIPSADKMSRMRERVSIA